jgi:hypothetical protein
MATDTQDAEMRRRGRVTEMLVACRCRITDDRQNGELLLLAGDYVELVASLLGLAEVYIYSEATRGEGERLIEHIASALEVLDGD